MEYRSTILHVNWPTHYVLTLFLEKSPTTKESFDEYLEILISNNQDGIRIRGTLVHNPEATYLEIAVHMDAVNTSEMLWLNGKKTKDEVFVQPLTRKPTYVKPALFIAEGFGLTKYMWHFRNQSKADLLRLSNMLLFNDTALNAYWLTDLETAFDSNFQHIITRNRFDPNYMNVLDSGLLTHHYKPHHHHIYFQGSTQLYKRLFESSPLKARCHADFLEPLSIKSHI